MKVALIPCGTTEWDDEGRLLGRIELPLTSTGQARVGQWVAQLRADGLKRILHAPDELATQTATILARQLAIPTKALNELAEVDLGLWTGLTETQLKTRFASAHRELREAPLNVIPPGGESLRSASNRLLACIRKQLKKNGHSIVGVILRPFSWALVRAGLAGSEPTDLWEATRDAGNPVVIESKTGARRSPAP
jgi:broad specificity phosphatase PhoE